MHNRTRYPLIIGIVLLGVIGVMMLPAIPQDPGYHAFGAPLSVSGIPNFWNVVSNIPFAIVGLTGLAALFYRRRVIGAPWRIADLMYAGFSVGVLLTAFGSSYYHWRPVNQTLVWDRLPMTISFMSLLCLVVYHFESRRLAAYLFAPLLAVGFWSVAYWASSEAAGAGDLRPYALVQFLPLLVLPLIIHGRQSADFPRRYLWMALGGHPFKYVFAAFATFCVVLSYIKSTGEKQELTFRPLLRSEEG